MAPAPALGLGVRTYLRYLVPLSIVGGLVLAPLWYVALAAPWPVNLATANAALRRGWLIGASAWMFQLVLVAAAAPLVRACAARTPPSQLRALGSASANVVRMALPCAAACAAITIGGLALVIPGLALLAMFSLTGASTEHGLPAPLVDSAAAARANLRLVAIVALAMLAVDLGLVLGAWKLATVPFAKKLAREQWATYGNVARIVAGGLVVASPIFASILAAIRSTGVTARPS